MDECTFYHHLVNKIDRSKNDFLDWFEYLFQIDGKHEDLYDIVIGWSDKKTTEFAKWFDWDIDKIRFRVWKWDKEYIEIKENDLAFAGQSRSIELIKYPSSV